MKVFRTIVDDDAVGHEVAGLGFGQVEDRLFSFGGYSGHPVSDFCNRLDFRHELFQFGYVCFQPAPDIFRVDAHPLAGDSECRSERVAWPALLSRQLRFDTEA